MATVVKLTKITKMSMSIVLLLGFPAGRRSGRCVCIGDLHRNEHRRGRQFLLLATQNTPGDAIAACDLSLA
jgi:hypothetical protein